MTKSTSEHPNGSYALVNGLNMYYEIHGSGQPLVLLPGGFWTVEAMGEIVPQLAVTRRVIAVELQGHGHTADIDRPIRYELMADDIAALITHLGLERADIFAFSLGGGVGLQTAIQHPEVVRKLALASTAFKRDGWYPEVPRGNGFDQRRRVRRDPDPRSLSQGLAQARSLADRCCQDKAAFDRGLRLGRGRCGAQNTHPDPGRGRR